MRRCQISAGCVIGRKRGTWANGPFNPLRCNDLRKRLSQRTAPMKRGLKSPAPRHADWAPSQVATYCPYEQGMQSDTRPAGWNPAARCSQRTPPMNRVYVMRWLLKHARQREREARGGYAQAFPAAAGGLTLHRPYRPLPGHQTYAPAQKRTCTRRHPPDACSPSSIQHGLRRPPVGPRAGQRKPSSPSQSMQDLQPPLEPSPSSARAVPERPGTPCRPRLHVASAARTGLWR